MQTDERPVLDYLAPTKQATTLVELMQRWQWIATCCFVMMLVGSLFYRPFASLAFIALVVAIIMTLQYMTRAAAGELGTGYAVRHLILALVLLPFFLLGLFMIPGLVASEIRKSRTSSQEGEESG
jgi:hypothetical protein